MSCEQHKKEVAGISDMKALAEMIGDLHYKQLRKFLFELSNKISKDADKDISEGRIKLGNTLVHCHWRLSEAADEMLKAWKISKPFMAGKQKT